MMTPSPFSRAASATVSGLVSVAAQTFAGPKTFDSKNGSGASDVGTTIGTSVADASVSTTAKILSSGTGIGGTYVEYLFLQKASSLVSLLVLDTKSTTNASHILLKNQGAGDGGLTFEGSPANGGVGIGLGSASTRGLYFQATNRTMSWWVNNDAYSGSALATFLFESVDGSGTISKPWMQWDVPNNHTGLAWNFRYNSAAMLQVTVAGMLSQSGTDSTGTPGAATINKPTGKSAIAAGASNVVITNSLVTAASNIIITPHARDATCKELIVVPAAGSFTVSGTANATAALPFSWRVANHI